MEMGIRAVPRGPEPASGEPAAAKPARERSVRAKGPGGAYLEARAGRYRMEEGPTRRLGELVERFRSAFAGLFVKLRAEPPVRVSLAVGISEGKVRIAPAVDDGLAPRLDPGSFSLCFLVPRARLSAFRETFDGLRGRVPAQLLLSGPWPPYSFVLP